VEIDDVAVTDHRGAWHAAGTFMGAASESAPIGVPVPSPSLIANISGGAAMRDDRN
jgi:hypothetical protein